MSFTEIPQVFLVLLFCVGVLLCPVSADAVQSNWTELGFDNDWSDTWRSLKFPGKKSTSYKYEADSNAICGDADESASALIRPFPRDVTPPYTLGWEWKINTPVPGGNALEKSGDDYSARVYLNFRAPGSLNYWQSIKQTTLETVYGQNIPDQSLNFIWANRVERGRVLPSPYTDQTQLVVLRNRGDSLGRWNRESVTIEPYYRKAFGGTVPEPHSIAIMTDSDNTQASVRGCYRSLKIK
jgi:hypothetical protein